MPFLSRNRVFHTFHNRSFHIPWKTYPLPRLHLMRFTPKLCRNYPQKSLTYPLAKVANGGRRWGLSAPKPRTKGLRPLDSIRRKDLFEKITQLPPVAGGYERMRASGPRKPEKSQRESSLSPSGLFPGFPRMRSIRLGRFQRPGQKHKVVKPVCSF